ncbi:response regulator transcription factor [Streptococcus massiliensis]|uniref:AraC family transcriptional regulator n=1 Tax=Streptococcus massiliensis TaxID=313439 RepID=A0A380L1Y6_9STRE|nr:DNA-binding response regulator [Streptococcus massiliensis]SUN77247.1 AraC family transcriptional regulator [Streptococcus massiliensis]
MKTIVISEKDALLVRAFETVIHKIPQCQLAEVVRKNKDLLSICEYQVPDMIFMEVTDEDMALIAQLHKLYPSIAIYVMTFSNDFRFIKALLNSGIRDYILKPISIIRIRQLIENEDDSLHQFLIEKLLAITVNRRFDQIHETIEEMSGYIVKGYRENPNKTKYEVDQMLKEAISLMNCLTKAKRETYQEQFSLTRQMYQEKFRVQFLLFQIIDELFKQQSIQKTQQLAQYYRYIDENISENISLSDAAIACNMSQSYLSRLIKERYHIGFNLYIQYRKIEMAKQLFYFNDEKIIDAAFQLSYSEPSYFCKVFKKIEGVPPMVLKKEMEQEKLVF